MVSSESQSGGGGLHALADNEKTCFVIMGFGVKTDFVTGRSLDLDKSYRTMIRPTVMDAGVRCVRADEIVHSGSIDIMMYRHLLDADLVIADISTCNPNALHGLGVRHALRPSTTITIARPDHLPVRRQPHRHPPLPTPRRWNRPRGGHALPGRAGRGHHHAPGAT